MSNLGKIDEIGCPVCGCKLIKEPYDICPVCGWEYDPIQHSNLFYSGGANKENLGGYRMDFNEMVEDEQKED